MTAKKKYTPADLKKAIEEAYSLGLKHGSKGQRTLGLNPAIEAELQMNALNKSLDANGQKINKEILENHSNIVAKQMKEWAKDKASALNDILKEAHSHGSIKKDGQKA